MSSILMSSLICVFDGLGNVGDPNVVGASGRGIGLGDGNLVRRGLRGCGHCKREHVGLRLSALHFGLSFGLGDHLLGVFLREDAALHEFVDEVDRDALRGRAAALCGLRNASQREGTGGDGGIFREV